VSSIAHNAETFAWMLIIGVTGFAALLDLKRFRVPNRLTISVGLLGISFYAILFGWTGFVFSATGWITGFLLLITFFLIGVMGAGDIKLLAAVGAWVGPANSMRVCLIACLAAGVYSVAVCLARGRWRQSVRTSPADCRRVSASAGHVTMAPAVEELVLRENRRWRVLPFAPMIAVGVFVSAVWEYVLLGALLR
jgi:prepilin peptidase CpaA